VLRFTWTLFVTNFKGAIAQRGAFVMQALFMMLNNAVFFTFWWVLLSRVPDIRGWRLADMQLMFGITATSYGLVVAFAGGVRELGRSIDEGTLDTLLTQPKPTLLYAAGTHSRISGFGDLISGVCFIILSGYAGWANVPVVAMAVGASALTFLSAGILFFSLPFWLSRSETVSRQAWEMLLTFSLYPDPLFGGALRLLLFTLLPAGLVAYLPIELIKHPSMAELLTLTIAVVAYFRFAVWVFTRGLRRYASGSRFVVFG